MQKHELRNEQPPLEERDIELLIYGVFSGFDGDKGYYYTAWVPLGDVLMSISPETVIAKLARFRDGLARVRWMLPAPFQLRIPRRMAQAPCQPPPAQSPMPSHPFRSAQA